MPDQIACGYRPHMFDREDIVPESCLHLYRVLDFALVAHWGMLVRKVSLNQTMRSKYSITIQWLKADEKRGRLR
jgi:hypothetical protein